MKNILILSGVHGNEYSAVGVGVKLKKYYDGVQNITVIPFANQKGLLAGTREIPNTHTTDLNRMFDSTHDTFESIKQLIDDHDVVIDIHNSPDCAPFVLLNNDKHFRKLARWASLANTDYASRNSTANTIKKYCLGKNKLAVTYEFGDMTKCTEHMLNKVLDDIKSLVDFSSSCADYDMSHDSVAYPKYELTSYVAHDEGYVERLCEIGRIIEVGETLFRVVDSDLNEITYIATKCLKVMIWGENFVEDGSEVFHYIEI